VDAGQDIAVVREALALEREAVERYTTHPAASSDPRLVAHWESLRRNEAEHRVILEDWLRAHGADPDAETAEGAQAPREAAAAQASAAAGPDLAGGTADGEVSPPAGRGYVRDLAALRLDFAFEARAVKRYGQMAGEAGEAGLSEVFKELARGEAGHRRGLVRMIAALEDPETPVILFCPLCGWQIDFGPAPAEGAVGKCPMCPGRFALRLSEGGDWILERLAP
jgi:rubrerythrin